MSTRILKTGNMSPRLSGRRPLSIHPQVPSSRPWQLTGYGGIILFRSGRLRRRSGAERLCGSDWREDVRLESRLKNFRRPRLGRCFECGFTLGKKETKIIPRNSLQISLQIKNCLPVKPCKIYILNFRWNASPAPKELDKNRRLRRVARAKRLLTFFRGVRE